MADDKFDELIQKQIERENKMKEVREDYINEMGELPKKQITVKLFPNTHKTLKVIVASKDTTIEKIATAIIEDKISDLDIVKYVKMSFDNSEKIYGWLVIVGLEDLLCIIVLFFHPFYFRFNIFFIFTIHKFIILFI